MPLLTKADVHFEVDGTPVDFSVIHDLPAVKGMSFEDALYCWLARTNKYTAKSLCKYINSKDIPFRAMTEEEYKKSIQQQ